jgi:hypothetical protein
MRRRDGSTRSIRVAIAVAMVAAVVAPAAPAAAATAWSISPSPSPPAPARGRLEGVTCLTASSCIAVGSYTEHLGHARPLVGRWTGTTWQMTPAPIPADSTSETTAELRGVACASTNRCFAVGTVNQGSDAMLVEQWNGTAWSVVLEGDPPGNSESALSGISCRNSTTCYAAGSSFDGSNFHPLVERWNGTSWTVVPSPNPAGGIGGAFSGVSCRSTPACFAVGAYFSNTTKTLRTLVETWTGTAWAVVASPNPGGQSDVTLRSISCPSTTSCFAVGGTQPRAQTDPWQTLIERWNGTAWSIVASPNPPGAHHSVLQGVDCSSTSDCWAVGFSVGTGNHYLIERWHGGAWTVATAPNPGGSTTLGLEGVACPAASACIAVGSYPNNSRALTMVDRWNGSAWAFVANGGSDARLRRVSCVTPTNCFAVGDAFNGFGVTTLIERWNGTSWSIVASPNPAGTSRVLTAVSCATASMCVAVGQYLSGTTVKPLAELWNGSTWSIVATPAPGGTGSLNAVTCVSATSCFAAGSAAVANGSKPLVERWNGTAWSIATTPNPDPTRYIVLNGVGCVTATNCLAAGTSTANGGENSKTMVLRWNGIAWSVVASPNSSSDYTFLNDVACASTTNCFAVGGSQTFFLDDPHSIVERWNGTTWSMVTSPDTGVGNREWTGVACATATSCAAVGDAPRGDLSSTTRAAQWSGASWSAVTTPNQVGAFASRLEGVACRPNGACYAVGSSTTDVGESTLVERNT